MTEIGTSPAARVTRSNCFDFLRLFAASVVVIAHSQADLGTTFAWNVSNLFDGVGMFFIMSGMLVWRSGERTFELTGSWRDFLLNRYLRVAPGIYAFALLVPVILVAAGAITIGALFNPQLVVWLGSSAVLLPNFHPSIWEHVGTGVLNGPLYTIPAEVSFYLAVPVLVWISRRWGFPTMLALMIGVSIAGPVLTELVGGTFGNVLHHTFIERAAYFTVGIIFARYWKRMPQSWPLFAAAVALYLFAKFVLAPTEIGQALHPALVAAPLGYAVVFFGYRAPRILSRLTERVGDLSFGTYVWHAVLINLLLWVGIQGQWWLAPAVLAAAWLIAAASWWGVERPALKLKRVSSRSARRPQPALP